MQASTKLLGIALPVALVVSLVALLTLGATPQVGGMPDVLAYALELAPRTMYALAIGGSAVVAMHMTGMDIGNARRCDLMQEAAEGNRNALWVLVLETGAWLSWTVLWAFVYLR